ncbi:hypothetical protein [Rothia nasisuis]|uniref:hypothetical protein n=1 Tax=Rothia nasisuis TaxID=2109647 RepID=UPI001F21EDAE|nr:hypothetical protein [Rothia nasisuis]
MASTSTRKKLPQSTQMLIAASVTEGLAILFLVLAFVVNVGSPATVLATLLGFMTLSVVAATLAFILALVGLLRYSRHSGGFITILVISVLANPVLWFFVLGYLA